MPVLVVQVRSYLTLWQRPGTSFSVMFSRCCRPSSIQFRCVIARLGCFLFVPLSMIVHLKVLKETDLFPYPHWIITSLNRFWLSCTQQWWLLPCFLSICAGQGAVRPPACAASLQEHHSPEREIRRRPLSASCSRATLCYTDAANSSGRPHTATGGQKGPDMLIHWW